MTRDPADGFLVATAQILDLTLVTTDQQLLGLGKIKTLANR
jgi:PIN domain nuclease of toxin-antitoxin system